jgi:hypothetical protein
MDDRRRAERIPVRIPARLFLTGGVETAATIVNIGELGVLLAVADLEIEVREGDRALLEHPRVVDGKAQGGKHARTSGAVVRVDLDLDPAAVVRHVALYFDGGPRPVGVGA